MCKLTGYKDGKVRHHLINVHIYEPHIEGIREQLSRQPTKLNASINIRGWVEHMQDVTEEDIHAREYFTLEGYGKEYHQGKIYFELIA
jgi:thymidylate synthase